LQFTAGYIQISAMDVNLDSMRAMWVSKLGSFSTYLSAISFWSSKLLSQFRFALVSKIQARQSRISLHYNRNKLLVCIPNTSILDNIQSTE
jgi:hypothetical protein